MISTKSVIRFVSGCLVALLVAPLAQAEHEGEPGVPAHKQSLGTIGRKLNDPTSDIWALQFEFDTDISRGRLSGNDYKYGGKVLFQPIMPFAWSEHWKLLTRPVVPIVFSTDVPTARFGEIEFPSKAGLGDIELPLFFSPKPTSRLSLGKRFSWALGPTWSFPTATSSSLGSGKWEVGPVALALYKDHNVTTGALMEYWWSFAGDESRDSTSHASILYFFYYSVGTWQFGTNPTISFNDKATSGNKWNVPIGLTVGKTVKIGGLPMKIQVGLDYSVVHQRDFGEQWKVKLQITPVIPGLVKKPLTQLFQR